MKALTVTASILFAVLLLGIGWLAFFPGDAGDPVVTVAVSPPPPKPVEPPPSAQPAAPGSSIDLPPGFGIAPLRPQSGQGGAPATQQQQAANQPHTGSPAPGQPATVQTVAIPAPPGPPPALPPPPEDETASITLVQVPVPELVEESQYGPLPKVATDGRRPIDVYARPSKYAEKAAPGEKPRIAVLINGMGLSDGVTAEAIKGLPAPISVAYGAYGRNLQDWVERARGAGHEVLLQVPLEPLDYPTNDPGPHTLLTTLPPEENMKRLQWLMSRFTGYVGVTNQMGAKFETTQASLTPMLEEIKARGLLFVDDGTVKDSAGSQVAGTIGLDYAAADVQIDAVPSPDDINKALARLEAVAKEKGSAIGVASAKPGTIKQISQWAGQLQGKGIVLIPVSAAIRSQRQS
ncbi:MAG TPA: divergent polysaccharide deacetylase family protein [Methyloceanibacter sp.]|jgi:polysaccharide deacetylase 2 family uncharacterized protein YibQ|nr:divergent polysaccharide deacetylase family protein [Methyloceanibacter sp.]